MWGRLLFRLRAIFGGDQAERELAEELQGHLDQEIARHVAAGMSLSAATARARREFGNLGTLHETARDSWRIEFLDRQVRNARVAVRALRRRPTFALTAILSLALGLGAATTVFSVAESLLLRPLPYRNPSALVAIWPSQIVANQEIDRLRTAAHSYSNVASFSPGWLVGLNGVPQPRQLNSAKVSGNFFAMLGIKPIAGRAFDLGAETPGNDQVAVISEALWESTFNRDPAIIGRSITLDGSKVLVLGVMPRTFQLIDPGADLWMPMAMNPDAMSWTGGTTLALGELRPGTSIAAAAAELRTLVPQMQKDFTHPPNWGQNVDVISLQQSVTSGLTGTLTLLLLAVGFLLLIAVTNVINLLLVRTSERAQELGVRASLGATERQLRGLLLVEGLLLSLAGGTLGIVAGYAGMGILRRALPPATPRLAELTVDIRVLVLAVLAMVAIGLVFSLAPARLIRSGSLATALRRGRGQTARDGRTRGALVAMEFALAMLLSTGALLMGRTLLALQHVDRGIHSDHMLALKVQPSVGGDTARRVFWREALQRVAAVPGVTSATTMLHLPMSGRSWHADVTVENRPVVAGASPQRTAWQSVAPNYFDVTGVRVLRGRAFGASDDAAAPLAVLVNAAFARTLFPGEDPVGQRIQAGNATARQWATIIGIVGDMPHDSLNVPAPPEIYVSMEQRMVGATSLLVRTRGEPASVATAVRAALSSVNAETAISDVRALDDYYRAALQRPRLILQLLAFFALSGTLLSAIGIYGVVAYGVRRRTREIGIRAALGADAGRLQWVFLRESIAQVAVGFTIGIPAAFVAARLVRSLLFGVEPFDMVSFGSVAGALLVVAIVASWIPARRATRVDPAGVLNES